MKYYQDNMAGCLMCQQAVTAAGI